MIDLSRLVRAIALLALVALLAGCTIRSTVELVAGSETTLPLPASFVLIGYEEGNGGFAPGTSAPSPFTAAANGYVSADGSTVMHLVPVEGEDAYLIQFTINGEFAYGLAQIRDQVLALTMLIDGDDPEAAVANVAATAPDAIAADLAYSRNGLAITRRDTLDYLLPRLADGTIPTRTLILWMSKDPAASPPKLIRWIGDRAEVTND